MTDDKKDGQQQGGGGASTLRIKNTSNKMEDNRQWCHLEHNLKNKELLEEPLVILRRINTSDKVEDDKQLRNSIRVTFPASIRAWMNSQSKQ